MNDCIFCKIIENKIPSKIVYEDDLVLAFEDVNPHAPVHTLIIPKRHIPTLLDITDPDLHLFGHMVKVANGIARDKGIAERGFRLVTNCNPEGGQAVFHVHFHLLGGRQLRSPFG
ncbi:MAG TPA: histidine triad nucleotide-binding protein [Dissulfurispiraceae bacterium]|nr:histidine triad nucleotide-binding protein [Dissulfurispiraceae bacterium]